MRKLHCTVQCLAIYDSFIDVPDGMSLDCAIEYAEKHIKDIPLGTLSYIQDSDMLDKDNCTWENTDE